MRAAHKPPMFRSWVAAILLSLGLHASLFFAFSFLSGTDPEPGSERSASIDTRVSPPPTEVSVVLFDEPMVSRIDRVPAVQPTPVSARSRVAPAPIQPSQLPSAGLRPEPHTEPEPGYVASASREQAAGNASPTQRHSVGPQAGTGLFEMPAQVRSVVYVIDRSASMGLHGSMDAAKQALLASLHELPATSYFQVIFYNRVAEPLRIRGRTDLATASVENKLEVVALLEKLRAEGSTDHFPALERALAYHPDVIFLLTDADDMKVEQVRAVTLRNRGRSVINAIELSSARREETDVSLKILANQNRGAYRRVDLAPGS